MIRKETQSSKSRSLQREREVWDYGKDLAIFELLLPMFQPAKKLSQNYVPFARNVARNHILTSIDYSNHYS